MQRDKRERISPADFYKQKVRPRLTVELVYGRVAFKSTKGRYRRGPCPLHGGKDPNFSVDTFTLKWRCFSRCGSGDALDFVNGGTHPGGKDFVDCVRKLADLVGVDTSPLDHPPSPEEEARLQEREKRQKVLEAFFEVAREALTSDAGKHGREYLEQRGFTGEQAGELFGFYTSQEDVRRRLQDLKIPVDEIPASGLLHDGRWEGRLVIPWRDAWGDLGTFAARDLTGKAENADKYLYMKGTNKAELVAFGLDVALRQGGRDLLVLVEGLLDVVLLQARDFGNVAAIGGNGKEMSSARWDALGRLKVRSVTLCLDNDDAGKEGTRAALDNTRKGSNTPVVYVLDPVELGDCKDPDELVRKKGLDAFREVLKKRIPGAVYGGVALLGDVTPDSPDRVRREAVERVARYVEKDLRGSWSRVDAGEILRVVSERTGWNPDALEPIFKAAEERGRGERVEKDLDAALQEALAGRREGKSALELGRDLSRKLASFEVRLEEPPPPFSVERLVLESRDLPVGRLTGWNRLDDLGVRFNPGELSLLGARTGHAKTAALVGLIRNWLDVDEKGVLVFYSMEEPEVPIFHRLLSLLTADAGHGWTADDIRYWFQGDSTRNYPSPEDLEKAQARLRELEDRLFVVWRPSWTTEKIEAHLHDLADSHDVAAVLVDYLQRIPPTEDTRNDRRDIQVSAIARRFKTLSVDFSVPVIAGAQINREAVKGVLEKKNLHGKSYEEAMETIRKARPRLHHLREGGSEQEADLVLGLLNYRADYETNEEDERIEGLTVPPKTDLDVGILKNRTGDVGRWARLKFEGRFRLIRDP